MKWLKSFLRRGLPNEPSKPSKSDYWKYPNCGAILEKPIKGAIWSEVNIQGTSTCAPCGAGFSASDVYGGKYDVSARETNDEKTKAERIRTAAEEFRELAITEGMSARRRAKTSGASEEEVKESSMNAMVEVAGRVARKHGLSGSLEEVIAVINEAFKDQK